MNANKASPRLPSLAVRVLLIAALFSMAFTWVPEASAPKGPIPIVPLFAQIYLTSGFQPDILHVSGLLLPPNHIYNVQVRKNNHSPWYYVGSVQADAAGQFSASFNMPIILKGLCVVRVCIKDTLTGKKLCTLGVR